MSDAELTTLVDQLLDAEDPKVRRDAARRMGELRNPSAITYLVQAYTGDSDQAVRKAAERALLTYRRMEQQRAGAQSGSKETITIGNVTLTADQLSLFRRILTVVLVVTVVGNVALFAVRAIKTLASQQSGPVQTVATPRDELVNRLQIRIDTLKTEAPPIRKKFTNFQAELEGLNRVPKCETLEATAVRVGALAEIDGKTYPDIGEANAPLVIAEQKYLEVRGDYESWCKITDLNTLKGQVASRPGGAVFLVNKLDEAVTKDLSNAQALLDRAIRSPAPTVGPSVTPTPTITPTSSETPTPAPTETPGPTPTPGEATTEPPTPESVQATAAPTVAPTQVAVAPQPPEDFNAGFPVLARYQVDTSFRYSSVYINNQPFSGSVRVVASYQGSPLLGDFLVTLNETPPEPNFPSVLRSFTLVPELFFVPGTRNYTVLNNNLYTIGSGTRRPCEITRINRELQTAIGQLAAYDTGQFDAEQRAKLQYIGEENGLQHWVLPVDRPLENNATQSGKIDIYYSPSERLVRRFVYTLVLTLKFTSTEVKVDISGESRLLNIGDDVTLPTADKLPLACRR